MSSIATLAAVAHEDWRKGFQASNGVDGVKLKPTGDRAWLSTHAGQPYCDPANSKVNINIDFDKLPLDWQAENYAAVAQAIQACAAFADDRAAATSVHQAWVDRRRAEGKGEEDWVVQLSADFNDLPEAEQEKDLVIVRSIRKVLGM